MKIIQAIGWYFPESMGGTEVYVAALCRRLAKHGHEVKVAAPDPARAEAHEYRYEQTPVYRYPITSAPTRDEAQGRITTSGVEQFHAWLQRERADVVHFHTFVRGLSLPEVQAAKASGARVIVTTHDSALGFICQRGTLMQYGEHLCDGVCEPHKCAACELQHRGLPKPLAQIVGALPVAASKLLSLPGRVGTMLSMPSIIMRNQQKQRALLQTVDRFVVLTQRAYDIMLANGAPRDKLALNRLGVGHEVVVKKPDRPTTSPVKIGYLGRYFRTKGVHVLAAAVAQLPRELPIEIEFRGPVHSPVEHKILAELKQLIGDDPRVTFAPAVDSNGALAVLASYDALCCPSLCLEGGPLAAVEAQAVGTPTIGSAIGGIKELAGDAAQLVPPNDAAALAQLLVRIARDPVGTIDHFRRIMPPARTMDDVTRDYLALFGVPA